MGSGPEALVNAIARQSWLEELAEPLVNAIRGAFPGKVGQEIKDALHGTWLGHPLHPALVAIPVGAWTAAMALDAMQSMSGNDALGDAADAAIGIGLVGAVGSAITGATDWSESDGRGKTIGLMHGLLNVAATALYTTAFILRRRRKQRQTGVALSMLGFAVANSAAWLGGHLVFGEQLGVDHTATPDAENLEDFTATRKEEADLAEDTPTRVTVKGVKVLLVKRKGRIFGLSETCPHLGGPLSEGKLVGDAIECPWHGSQLNLEDGSVERGPTTFPARCYDVRVREGRVEVRRASSK